MYMIKCRHCSEYFKPDHPRRRYCSEACVKEVKSVYLIVWRRVRRAAGLPINRPKKRLDK